MRLSELATRLGGVLHGEDGPFDGFALDSREASMGKVFLAVRGANVDGHNFVGSAMANGAVAAVVERSVGQGPEIIVANLIDAIARFGRSLRDEFHGPVVGITGSNGKTTAKELTAAALSPLGGVLKTHGNQNSEFTSPLTWFGLRPEHQAAVIEMGMRGKGQITHLADISHPTVGLITMIGTAHIEMVGSRQGIAEAKTELFRALPSDGVAICWAEDEFLPYLRSQAPGRVRTFGFGPDAELKVVGYRALSFDRCEILVDLGGDQHKFELGTIGRHQALNAAAALLVADTCGVPVARAVQAIQTAEFPPMRMEMRDRNGVRVLLDTYNASPDSMVAAIKTLTELPATGRRLAILGEMKELGAVSELGHRQVGRELAHAAVDAVILYGAETRFTAAEALQAGLPAHRMVQAEDLDAVREFLSRCESGDLVLIKGSRALGLEKALEDPA